LAATRLLERLEKPARPAHHDQVSSRLVVRGTTGPVNSSPTA
jgi:DNA-binding LacI/PurR family transcriptional regulator